MASVRGGQSWRNRHLNDHYVKEAQKCGYRARSAFKLLDIHTSKRLIKPGMRVLDLGAAPGGWSQVATEKGAKVVGVDLLPIEPVNGATFIQGNFLHADIQEQLISDAGGLFELILSDMAPNLTGQIHKDMADCLEIYETVLTFIEDRLKPGGSLLMKVFAGRGIEAVQQKMKQQFNSVRAIKPKSSRNTSKEYYLLAEGYNIKR